jgi:hypothetical protein
VRVGGQRGEAGEVPRVEQLHVDGRLRLPDAHRVHPQQVLAIGISGGKTLNATSDGELSRGGQPTG